MKPKGQKTLGTTDITETQVSQEINITGIDNFFVFFFMYIVYIVYVVLRCKYLGQNFKCVELVTFGMYLFFSIVNRSP